MKSNGKRIAALFALVAAYAASQTERLDEAVAGMFDAAKEIAAPSRAADAAIAGDVAIAGEAAIVVDQDSGKVLFAKAGDKRMYPASTTKIMTALLALERGALDDIVLVGEEARPASPDESAAGLAVGTEMSLRDLLSALMLPSGNDAARVIAKYVVEKTEGGLVDDWNAAFAALMNAKAEALGARDTHFANPHGLHDPEHYSTAYDLALIAREAMRAPSFREIVASNVYVTEAGDASFGNRNKLLDEEGAAYFRGANGIKTGYTSAAGYCLVASAERDGRALISVVLRSTEAALYSDTHVLLSYGFS